MNITDNGRLTITPELHRRAEEYLVDRLLALAESIGSNGNGSDETRSKFGVAKNPAMVVQETAAQMALALARSVHAGDVSFALEAAAPPAPEATAPEDLPSVTQRVEPTFKEWESAWYATPMQATPGLHCLTVCAEAYRLAAERSAHK